MSEILLLSLQKITIEYVSQLYIQKFQIIQK